MRTIRLWKCEWMKTGHLNAMRIMFHGPREFMPAHLFEMGLT
jgi:hypothetical protein